MGTDGMAWQTDARAAQCSPSPVPVYSALPTQDSGPRTPCLLGRRVVGVSLACVRRASGRPFQLPTTWVVGLLVCKSMAAPLRVPGPGPWAGRHTAEQSDSSLAKASSGSQAQVAVSTRLGDSDSL
jgi:hypothetical protein